VRGCNVERGKKEFVQGKSCARSEEFVNGKRIRKEVDYGMRVAGKELVKAKVTNANFLLL
jgi:hypothetical protein